MKLKIADKWKWIAKDKSGHVFLYTHKPTTYQSFWGKSEGRSCGDISAISAPDLGEWRDSLHEILPDGTLKKHVERPDLKVDDRVLCKYLNGDIWVGRHFAGWSEDGDITCWVDGRTSWTSSPDDWMNWTEWKLPEDYQPCK